MKHKSLYKTVTYRLGSIILTVLLLRAFKMGWLTIGLYTFTSQLIKAIFYYLHEKMYKWIKRRYIVKGKFTRKEFNNRKKKIRKAYIKYKEKNERI